MDLAYILSVTIHLVAMAAWMAPMIAVPAILASYGPAGPAPETRARLRGAFRAVATPGIALVWLFGIANATIGGWWDAGWLHAKLLFVLALSAVHGVMAARLRRMEAGGEVPALLRSLHWVVLALLFGAVLAVIWGTR